mmetsp:Transcript_82802/g.208506  ORF Transcript_82802/g.208506 Transcript_82802/m.208506 type:complete len:275 (+) Transcript_82802:1788-2612(+)
MFRSRTCFCTSSTTGSGRSGSATPGKASPSPSIRSLVLRPLCFSAALSQRSSDHLSCMASATTWPPRSTPGAWAGAHSTCCVRSLCSTVPAPPWRILTGSCFSRSPSRHSSRKKAGARRCLARRRTSSSSSWTSIHGSASRSGKRCAIPGWPATQQTCRRKCFMSRRTCAGAFQRKPTIPRPRATTPAERRQEQTQRTASTRGTRLPRPGTRPMLEAGLRLCCRGCTASLKSGRPPGSACPRQRLQAQRRAGLLPRRLERGDNSRYNTVMHRGP